MSQYLVTEEQIIDGQDTEVVLGIYEATGKLGAQHAAREACSANLVDQSEPVSVTVYPITGTYQFRAQMAFQVERLDNGKEESNTDE